MNYNLDFFFNIGQQNETLWWSLNLEGIIFSPAKDQWHENN